MNNRYRSIDIELESFSRSHGVKLVKKIREEEVRMFFCNDNQDKIRIYPPNQQGEIKVEVFGSKTSEEFIATREKLSWVLERAWWLINK